MRKPREYKRFEYVVSDLRARGYVCFSHYDYFVCMKDGDMRLVKPSTRS